MIKVCHVNFHRLILRFPSSNHLLFYLLKNRYRHTVLRALPHLQKLDNVAVDSEEVQQAMVCGLALPISDSPMAQRWEDG